MIAEQAQKVPIYICDTYIVIHELYMVFTEIKFTGAVHPLDNFEAFEKVCNGCFHGCLIRPGIKLVIFGHLLQMVSVCVNAWRWAC